jgi:accessory gene regulator protein AgrB
MQVNNGYLLDILQGSRYKATLLSSKAQIGKIVEVIAVFGLGLMIDKTSYAQGYLALTLFTAVLLVPVYFSIVFQRKQNLE